MHIKFRQYAQQMGMQNYRTILPEQIDLIINTSISDTTEQTLKEHLSLTNDGVGPTNLKVGQINAFSTLYKTATIPVNRTDTEVEEYVSSLTKTVEIPLSAVSNNLLYLFDAAVKYADKADTFPVRITDAAMLASTSQDYILRPSVKSPVGIVVDEKLTLYFGRGFDKFVPKDVIIYYIKQPAKVSFEGQVSCDLPVFLHENIVKHAIDLYRVSIAGSLYASQTQQQGRGSSRRQAPQQQAARQQETSEE